MEAEADAEVEVEIEVEPYTSITPKLISKAKKTPYKLSAAEIDRVKASCEDKLFDDEYAGLQREVMKWQVQLWLWETLCKYCGRRMGCFG